MPRPRPSDCMLAVCAGRAPHTTRNTCKHASSWSEHATGHLRTIGVQHPNGLVASRRNCCTALQHCIAWWTAQLTRGLRGHRTTGRQSPHQGNRGACRASWAKGRMARAQKADISNGCRQRCPRGQERSYTSCRTPTAGWHLHAAIVRNAINSRFGPTATLGCEVATRTPSHY